MRQRSAPLIPQDDRNDTRSTRPAPYAGAIEHRIH